MKVAVLDINGKDTGRKADLSNKVFAIEPNNHAVYLDVKQYLANQRQGTHKAKERGEIVGSTFQFHSLSTVASDQTIRDLHASGDYKDRNLHISL